MEDDPTDENTWIDKKIPNNQIWGKYNEMNFVNHNEWEKSMEEPFPPNGGVNDDRERIVRISAIATIVFYSASFLIAMFIIGIALVVAAIFFGIRAGLDFLT